MPQAVDGTEPGERLFDDLRGADVLVEDQDSAGFRLERHVLVEQFVALGLVGEPFAAQVHHHGRPGVVLGVGQVVLGLEAADRVGQQMAVEGAHRGGPAGACARASRSPSPTLPGFERSSSRSAFGPMYRVSSSRAPWNPPVARTTAGAS